MALHINITRHASIYCFTQYRHLKDLSVFPTNHNVCMLSWWRYSFSVLDHDFRLTAINNVCTSVLVSAWNKAFWSTLNDFSCGSQILFLSVREGMPWEFIYQAAGVGREAANKAVQYCDYQGYMLYSSRTVIPLQKHMPRMTSHGPWLEHRLTYWSTKPSTALADPSQLSKIFARGFSHDLLPHHFEGRC